MCCSPSSWCVVLRSRLCCVPLVVSLVVPVVLLIGCVVHFFCFVVQPPLTVLFIVSVEGVRSLVRVLFSAYCSVFVMSPSLRIAASVHGVVGDKKVTAPFAYTVGGLAYISGGGLASWIRPWGPLCLTGYRAGRRGTGGGAPWRWRPGRPRQGRPPDRPPDRPDRPAASPLTVISVNK